jgi:hypothetical protein
MRGGQDEIDGDRPPLTLFKTGGGLIGVPPRESALNAREPPEMRADTLRQGGGEGDVPGLLPLGEAEIGAALGVPSELAPYVHKAGPEVEVLLGERECLALAEAQTESEVDGEVIAVLQPIPHGIDGAAAPRLGLAHGRLGPLDRAVHFRRAFEKTLVVDRGEIPKYAAAWGNVKKAGPWP